MLILVLVFAALLNLLAASVIQSAGLQARMSGNMALQVESGLLAESMLEELLSRPAIVSLADPVGYRNCDTNFPPSECDENSLAALARVTLPAGSVAHYYTERRDPEVQTILLNSVNPQGESVSENVDIALFEVGAIAATPGVTTSVSTERAHLIVGLAVPLNGANAWPLYWREPAIDPP